MKGEARARNDQPARIHVEVDVGVGHARIRDLGTGDLDAIVNYWYHASDDFLNAVGVARDKLGSIDQLASRFERLIPVSASQPGFGFAIDLDEELVGYTNINHYGANDNVSHWHLINPTRRGLGISTALYPYRLRTYFSCVSMTLLTHQTRTSNRGMNKVLDRFVPTAETRFLSKPDGLATPGEFNIRYVRAGDVQRFLDDIKQPYE